jgi:hypothetical protein
MEWAPDFLSCWRYFLFEVLSVKSQGVKRGAIFEHGVFAEYWNT